LSNPIAANKHYLQQQSIAVTTAAGVNKLWSRMGADFDVSWQGIRPDVVELTRVGRMAAAVSSVGYTEAVLLETGQVAEPVGTIVPSRFIQAAPDGRPIDTLLDSAVVRSKVSVAAGATTREALQTGGSWLTAALLTVIADTSRQVVSTDIAQRPSLTGYVRMLNTPSCAACVILAGKWFKWNQGFQRHPRCDCRHIPAPEGMAGSMTTDPYAYFNSLSEDDQNKLFRPEAKSREGRRLAALDDGRTVRERTRLAGISNARTIRDGGDIYRVENINKRGLGTAKSSRLFGTPARATPDQIYRRATSRTKAIQMLTEEGYITGAQVVGGNIRGNLVEGFGQLGKGGAARAASDAVSLARRTGVRDPLNRYTMTAAERRLYDANYMLEYQLTRGTIPPSIGANTADIYSQLKFATPGTIASQRAILAREVAKLPDAPQSVWTLAKALGLL
jgi:hypothetical protein